MKCEKCGREMEESREAVFRGPVFYRCKECGIIIEGEVKDGVPISKDSLLYPETRDAK